MTETPAPLNERGMVTAELALGSVAVVLLLMIAAWAIALGVLQLRCVDTAAEVARQSARHDTDAVRRAQSDAPAGAEVTVDSSGDRVRVQVVLDARPGGLRLPSVRLRASAETLVEPT